MRDILGVGFCCVVLLAGCDKLPWSNVNKAHEAIRQNLVDPDSAEFRNESEGPHGDVCGEVNSKNRMGGYVGYNKFLWSSTGGVLVWREAPDMSNPPPANTAEFSEWRMKGLMYCTFVTLWAVGCTPEQQADMADAQKVCSAFEHDYAR